MSQPLYILIVDDDLDDTEFLIEAFRARFPDARFTHCKTGMAAISFLTALDTASDSCPDLTFLDLHMPGKTGFDTLVELKASGKCSAMPILIISTSLLDSEAERCRAAGCTDYFSKPVSFKEYDEIVSRSIAHLGQNPV